jgi:hypothetical protein
VAEVGKTGGDGRADVAAADDAHLHGSPFRPGGFEALARPPHPAGRAGAQGNPGVVWREVAHRETTLPGVHLAAARFIRYRGASSGSEVRRTARRAGSYVL